MIDSTWREALGAALGSTKVDPEMVERGLAMLERRIDHAAWWAYCALHAYEQRDLGSLDYLPARLQGASEGNGTYAARVAEWHATLDERLVTLRTWELALRIVGDRGGDVHRAVCRHLQRYEANAYRLTRVGRLRLREHVATLRADYEARQRAAARPADPQRPRMRRPQPAAEVHS